MASRFATIPGLAMVLALAAAAPVAAQVADGAAFDPLETFNRSMFTFNAAVSTVIVQPVADAYRSTVPEPIRTGIDNAFTNLREPLTIISSGLQGDFTNAGTSAGRFAVNTTVGIGGLFDVATAMGWVSRPEDLGSTLCSYGVPTGPYLVLPLVGPSTVREGAGLVATFALTFNIVGEEALGYIVADRVVAAVSDPPAGALAADPYVAQRDTYLAFRDAICKEAIPAAGLKASPLGGIVPAPG